MAHTKAREFIGCPEINMNELRKLPKASKGKFKIIQRIGGTHIRFAVGEKDTFEQAKNEKDEKKAEFPRGIFFIVDDEGNSED